MTEDIVRLLREGELVEKADGTTERRWPSQREIAERFKVSSSLVSQVAKRHQCSRRDVKPEKPVEKPVRVPKAPSKRGRGRPLKSETVIDYNAVDRLLVFGEVVEAEDGSTEVVYPSYHELARRFGIHESLIGTYAKKHNCKLRRQENQTRIALRAEQKLIEKRAEGLALGRDDVIRLIDSFLHGFEPALGEGRVRSDNPTDVNTMVRLKEFLQGGADSRQELHAALSLESIQQRHARMLRDRREEERPELTGMVMPTSLDPSQTADSEGEPARREVCDEQQEVQGTA